MRVTLRRQGKFVSTYGLGKITCASESRYELIIVDRAGRPVSPLTEWYRLRKQPGNDGTRRTYLGFLFPFFGYLLREGLAWNAQPEQIRLCVKTFLRDEVKCLVSRDTQLDGYLVELSGSSPLSQSSLRVLLAALRDFYLVMNDAGLYPYANPMNSQLLRSWKQEHIKHVVNRGAPDHAGIRGEMWQDSNTFPTAFFRQRRKQPWYPNTALTSEQVQVSLQKDLLWMIHHATTQRDTLVLLLLRTTGARLHEILSLTAGGYRKARDPYRAFVRNKGSHGCEEKEIHFPSAIEAALVRYVRTERARYDPQGRRRLEELDDTDPLFLTRRGTPYDREAFYHHWRKLYAGRPSQSSLDRVRTPQSMPIEFTPHDIRHLYVTWLLTQMRKRYGHDAGKMANLRWALQQRMAWRSPLTIECYDHSFSERERLEQFDEFQRSVEEQVETPWKQGGSPTSRATALASREFPDPRKTSTAAIDSGRVGEGGNGMQRDLSDLAFWKDER
ncbi:MAG TPA: tyrosine-type recombinase/integrase [Ktedonobacteraceae bacterium]|nr:tyrosine-type recombinase/integrase [Ktedonobacteraceae bacterium]